jgi:hypothetical protein
VKSCKAIEAAHMMIERARSGGQFRPAPPLAGAHKNAQAFGLSMATRRRKTGGDPRECADRPHFYAKANYFLLAIARSSARCGSLEATERMASKAIGGVPARAVSGFLASPLLALIEETSPARTPPFSISMSP